MADPSALQPSSAILILLFASSYLSRTVEGILCYQCNSTDVDEPYQCEEYMGEHGSKQLDIVPKSCDQVYGAAYCIKHTGRFEGGIGTRRYCSSIDMGNYCNYIKQPGDVREYRSCVYTCSSDGCNGADRPRSLAFVGAAFLALLRVW